MNENKILETFRGCLKSREQLLFIRAGDVENFRTANVQAAHFTFDTTSVKWGVRSFGLGRAKDKISSKNSNNQLHKYQIKPPVKFITHFFKMRYFRKTKLFVQCNAGFVCSVYTRNNNMQFHFFCSRDKWLQ